MLIRTRRFFSERKILQLEQEVYSNFDLKAQRQLFKELLSAQNFKRLVSKYEQPILPPISSNYSREKREQDLNRFKNDPIILDSYFRALVLDGKSIVDKLPSSITTYSEASNDTREDRHMDDPRLHLVHTDVDKWERAMNSRGKSTSKDEPIKVMISEAWSWSKLARNLGGKIFSTILILTGLSVVLETQGLFKSGMNSGEVEPINNTTVTFDDVQGVDEAKHELEEVVEFLKQPAKFMELGGKLPRGVLLYGPPGTGKTHLARAVAGEAGVPFFQISGSEFDELYVGVGARRVRELFASAKKRSPCIIFIDELDAVGSKRSMKDQSYMRQTLNQLLVEMDGFNPNDGVIVIAATNTPDSLDKALVRPGRFDRMVSVPLPDVKGRKHILDVHMKGVKFGKDVNAEVIARGTTGFSGADLANLVNQAAIKASKENAKFVTMKEMEWAKDKIIMGAERKSAVIKLEDKKLTAYHEGGHTLAALYTKGAIPLHKVTIIPRGRALGVTVMLPEDDVLNRTREEILAGIDVAMGGRVAEELIYGSMAATTGASSDLQNATSAARGYVLHYGMSDKIGLISWSEEDYARASPETKAAIEKEIKDMLEASYNRVKTLLKSKEGELHKLAAALIEQETLEADEVRKVIQ